MKLFWGRVGQKIIFKLLLLQPLYFLIFYHLVENMLPLNVLSALGPLDSPVADGRCRTINIKVAPGIPEYSVYHHALAPANSFGY
jgi:hypothetical protein